MKTLAALVLLFTFPLIVAQRKGISLTYEPVNQGLGARFDLAAREYGGYFQASAGSYYTWGRKVINRHIKISFGPVWYLKTKQHSFQNTLFAGICGHYYNGVRQSFPPLTLSRLSFEFGVESIYRRRFKFGAAYDPVKSEIQPHIGFMF